MTTSKDLIIKDRKKKLEAFQKLCREDFLKLKKLLEERQAIVESESNSKTNGNT